LVARLEDLICCCAGRQRKYDAAADAVELGAEELAAVRRSTY
jgi:hypothetical protein